MFTLRTRDGRHYGYGRRVGSLRRRRHLRGAAMSYWYDMRRGIRPCEQCGHALPGLSPMGTKYCDPRCRQRAHRLRRAAGGPRACGHCGEPRPDTARRWCGERCKRAAADWRRGRRAVELRACGAPRCPSAGRPVRHGLKFLRRGLNVCECAACGQTEITPRATP